MGLFDFFKKQESKSSNTYSAPKENLAAKAAAISLFDRLENYYYIFKNYSTPNEYGRYVRISKEYNSLIAESFWEDYPMSWIRNFLNKPCIDNHNMIYDDYMGGWDILEDGRNNRISTSVSYYIQTPNGQKEWSEDILEEFIKLAESGTLSNQDHSNKMTYEIYRDSFGKILIVTVHFSF